MKQMRFLIGLFLIFGIGLSSVAFAQSLSSIRNGVRDKRPEVYAFVRARVYVDYRTVYEEATLLVKEGRVLAVGSNVELPADAVIVDLKGKTIYPSFIDPYTSYGLEKVNPTKGVRYYQNGPQLTSVHAGSLRGWNDAVHTTYRADETFKQDKANAHALRSAGFGSVLSFRADGIVRGTGLVVALSDRPAHEAVIRARASAHYSFDKGRSKQDYPRSLMGAAALLRQTHYDAKWYNENKPKTPTNGSLSAYPSLLELPQLFESRHKYETLLADRIGDELGLNYIIVGAGDEYQRVSDLKATGAAFILPLNFPKPYEVSDAYDALDISLSDMKHWALAPSNAARLHQAGIRFAFTARGLKKPSDFLPQIRKVIQHGLSQEAALKAITYAAAEFLRVTDQLGSLKKDRIANFLITNGDIFDKKTIIHAHWVQGLPYELASLALPDYRGTYRLTLPQGNYTLDIKGKAHAPSAQLQVPEQDTLQAKVAIQVKSTGVSLSVTLPESDEYLLLSGWASGGGHLAGRGQGADGTWFSWTARYLNPFEAKADKPKEKKLVNANITYPFGSYGNTSLPKPKVYLVRGATVWTNEAQGIVQGLDVLFAEGKIKEIGNNLALPEGAIEVDGQGKHLTTGIIDEHSHIALFDVNEWSEAVTAEVRMRDVIDPEDINIYRQLAGGVTAAQLLHGSANPIGGQSALVKFRWGAAPEAMRIGQKDGFIKFALGENVKRSNAPPVWSKRFPQTRMGVEQVFVDAFMRARAYDSLWRNYKKNRGKSKNATTKTAPRKDLELEALAEILNKKRFITCHSYVQSEINMLMKVAERFGIRVNTFTHILEGYKVADKMKVHGAGGSTFSDWWMYKYEVRESIPYNATIMQTVGLVTAINSDDAEMGRRLNQEAGKTVKYGQLSEEEAWKTVTLNPARLLHLEDRMGSIKVGKDADLVLWSDNPLSIYAKAEKTFVDGTLYYDIGQDAAKQKQIAKERHRLVAEMAKAKKKGANTQPPTKQSLNIKHCDTLGGEYDE